MTEMRDGALVVRIDGEGTSLIVTREMDAGPGGQLSVQDGQGDRSV